MIEKDLFVIFRREELEGQFRVIREEERVERIGVKKEENGDNKDDQFVYRDLYVR